MGLIEDLLIEEKKQWFHQLIVSRLPTADFATGRQTDWQRQTVDQVVWLVGWPLPYTYLLAAPGVHLLQSSLLIFVPRLLSFSVWTQHKLAIYYLFITCRSIIMDSWHWIFGSASCFRLVYKFFTKAKFVFIVVSCKTFFFLR